MHVVQFHLQTVHVRDPSEVINVDFQAISDSKVERLWVHKGEKVQDKFGKKNKTVRLFSASDL